MTGIRETLTNALGLNRPEGRPSDFTLQVQALAARLHCTEGQVYSMAIGLFAALILTVTGSVPLGKAVVAAAANQPTTSLGDPVVPGVEPVTDLPQDAGADTPPDLPNTGGLGATPIGDGGGVGTGVDVPNESPSEGPSPTDPPSPEPPDLASLFKVRSPGFPAALASDAETLYVGADNATRDPSIVSVFARAGGLDRTIKIKGQPDGKDGGLSAAALAGDTLYATDRSRAALVKIDGDTQTVVTELPDLPACVLGVSNACQPGADDRPPSPQGLVIIEGFAYIADASQGTIWRYDFGSKKLEAWYSNADMTNGSGPTGLATDGSTLIFSVSSAIDPNALLQGAVYRLEIGSDGAPGARTLAASFPDGQTPGPVAIGSSGTIYAALLEAGGVVTIADDGTVSALTGAGSSDVPAPRGLNLADGVLYVADAGSRPGKSSGTVRAVTVTDGPAA